MGSVEDFSQQQADVNVALTEHATLSGWRNEDTGSIEGRVALLVGSVSTAAIIGFVGGMGAGVSDGVTLKAGKGIVESTYVMPANVCHGGYIDKVDGASAKVQASVHASLFGHSIGSKIPTDWISETFKGNVTSVICNTGTNGTRRVNDTTHTDHVSIPEGSLNTYVFVTDPLADNFTSDGGFAAVEGENNINLLNTVPGIHIGTVDDIHNVLQGFAELEAFNTSATTCGQEVWGHEEAPYINKIKQDEVTQLNDDDPTDYHWTTSDVHVEAPTTANFHTQYGNYLDQAEAEAKSAGITINAPTVAPECQDTSGPIQVLRSATEATDAGLSPNGIATPTPTTTNGGTK
jgi:hypothetical protein